ncbi:MAG TPA: SDR family oxidoreductase [Rudaea sp.]
MRILIAGATGFIGAALARTLALQGHTLRLAVRDVSRAQAHWPDAEIVQADFVTMTRREDWTPLLAGVDAIVNAVGLIAPTRYASFETVHVDAAGALFAAAAQTGARVVQISALGADDAATTAFHRSKRAADRALAESGVPACSVQPSLVFGAGGSSAQLFVQLAMMPLLALPAADARVQPIHIDDLCEAIAALLAAPHMPAQLAAVGSRDVTVEEYVAILRRGLGLRPARIVALSDAAAQAIARAGTALHLPFDRERWSMLRRGNCADAAAITQLLGRPPRAPEQFLTSGEATAQRDAARFALTAWLLRASVAIVWFVSGIVSLGVWPVADSLALLARCGLRGSAALVALYGAAALDIAFGLATLLLRRQRWVYDLQIALVLAYSAIIAVFLPQFLLHPYAPIVKNLVMLAAIAALRMDARR